MSGQEGYFDVVAILFLRDTAHIQCAVQEMNHLNILIGLIAFLHDFARAASSCNEKAVSEFCHNAICRDPRPEEPGILIE